MSDTSGSQPAQQMGHGVKQRAVIKMSEAEVDEFLAERHTMTLCSINHDGTIHAVAMWYGFLEGAGLPHVALVYVLPTSVIFWSLGVAYFTWRHR